jgi:hypothetical protein
VKKLLIAIASCQRDWKLGCHKGVRYTYGRDVADIADVRFFIGGELPEGLKDDEIHLPVADDYLSLPVKVATMVTWMLDHEYEFMMKADNDTYVMSANLRQCGYEKYDYAGIPNGSWGAPLCAWGGGYFLSRKAAVIIENEAKPEEFDAEDVMVGAALQKYIVEGVIKTKVIRDAIYGASGHRGAVHFLDIPPRVMTPEDLAKYGVRDKDADVPGFPMPNGYREGYRYVVIATRQHHSIVWKRCFVPDDSLEELILVGLIKTTPPRQ